MYNNILQPYLYIDRHVLLMAREEILFDDGFRFVEHDTSYKLVVIP